MRTITGSALVLSAVTLAIGGSAQAQETESKTRRVAAVDNASVASVDTDATLSDTVVLTPKRPQEMPAPRRAFEIGVEGGYTQPFGELGDGRSFRDVAEAGGAVGLSLGSRVTPYWALSVTGQFHDNVGDDNLGRKTDVRGMAAGVKATYHIRPYKMVDPYVSVGTGYRAMWLAPEGAPNELVHGFQLARALFGVDFRVSKDVSMGPMVGADINMFVWDNPQGDAIGNEQLRSPRPSTFLFGGLGATFDIGGHRVLEHPVFTAQHVPKAVPASAPATPREVRPRLTSIGISVDENIMTACRIDKPHAFFSFDSSDVKAPDVATLQQVATCFSSGPLKGQGLQIVGHADPRGTDEYNMQLGQSRADAVGQFLSAQGVSNSKVETASEGKRDAQGVDENGWTYDRRVDLQLVK